LGQQYTTILSTFLPQPSTSQKVKNHKHYNSLDKYPFVFGDIPILNQPNPDDQGRTGCQEHMETIRKKQKPSNNQLTTDLHNRAWLKFASIGQLKMK
jgi:hypothetical protein